MTINIIIPVLNEEMSLSNKISELVDFLDNSQLKEKFKVTIIDNGSIDKTPQLAQELTKKYTNKVFYRRLDSKGVGLAFRTGIIECMDDIVGYMDLDLATDIIHLEEVYNAFQKPENKIVVGSRLLKQSKVIGRSCIRNITSNALNWILKVCLRVKFSDAMCGFKFYRKNIALDLTHDCSDNNGWFYCAEMMIRAEWKNIEIHEIPVKWTDDPNSKVKIAKLTVEYLKEIFKLYKEKHRRS